MSFAGNTNIPGSGTGGVLPGGLGNVGTIAGMAGQVGALAGIPGAGLIGGAASAMQLAQTGLSLLGKTPTSIADAINSATGARALLTQDFRYI
ncbi:type VI secretion system tip protein VgrG, partial [Ralstonia pseudosolanacearum]